MLVIGYGNPLRMDDGLGLRAAEALEQALPAGQCEIIATHQLTPELCERIALASKVVFIDASAKTNGEQAGQIGQQSLQGKQVSTTSFAHKVSPESLLALSSSLFGSTPEAVLFSVEAASFDLGESLTPPVQAAMPELVQRIRDWLQ
jgi:hydrogenase maturation protease